MQRYIAQRLLLFAPTVLLASFVLFAILRMVPGDVALSIVGQEFAESGTAFSEKQVQDIRESLNLNDPIPVQYGKWVWSMVSGDFGGESIRTKEPISDIVERRLPVTVQLATYAFVLSMVIAIPFGIIAAVYQDKWQDYAVRVVAISGNALPHFWVAILILLVLVVGFKWSPPIFYANLWQDPWTHFQIAIWPTLVLALGFSSLTRVTRSNMLEVLRQDYIRTARAKGVSTRDILVKHALRNALLPVITLAGLQLGSLMGGTVILEGIFGMPGIGQGLVNAANSRDYPVVQALSMLLVLMMLTINLVVDILYGLIDPRVKYS
jgi:peptide/nickel transport system permease protein